MLTLFNFHSKLPSIQYIDDIMSCCHCKFCFIRMLHITSMARYVKYGLSTRNVVNWFSSVAFFNSHLCFPPFKGPKLMDTQLGSI